MVESIQLAAFLLPEFGITRHGLEKAGSEIIQLKLMTVDTQKGDVVVETSSTMFIRGEDKEAGSAA